MKNRSESCFGIFAVDTAAFFRTGLSLLKTLTVIFLALGLRALAATLYMGLLVMLHGKNVLAIETLAISATDPSLGETLAILGLTSGFGAFTLDLALYLGLFAVE